MGTVQGGFHKHGTVCVYRLLEEMVDYGGQFSAAFSHTSTTGLVRTRNFLWINRLQVLFLLLLSVVLLGVPLHCLDIPSICSVIGCPFALFRYSFYL